MWLKFSSFEWDINMRRIRSVKTLILGMPKAPQVNIQGRLKHLSLGMPLNASPLSSSKLSVYLTWSYMFIRLMICVLLGAYCHFTSCLNKIIGSEILNERESSHGYLTTWLLIDLHLYLFGVVCHLLVCFTYILWVNGWMNWNHKSEIIYVSYAYPMGSNDFTSNK